MVGQAGPWIVRGGHSGAISVQTVTPEAARRIAPAAALLARIESLEAHARAADARMELVR